MLVDLPGDWATSPDNPYASVFKEMGYPTMHRIAVGVYDGLNSHYLEHLIVHEYPFDPMFDKDMSPDERMRAVVAQFRDDTPRDFGVCDNYTQILDRWPSLLTDERHFVIGMREVRKADQPEHGGWRWHKNGGYIGVGEPQREHLADEDGFDSVWMFQILEAKPPVEPLYVHDHGDCVFLGRHDGSKGLADLYWCSQGGTAPTVIARFSDDGPGYVSGMALADSDLYLHEARNRAVSIDLKVNR